MATIYLQATINGLAACNSSQCLKTKIGVSPTLVLPHMNRYQTTRSPNV